MRRWSVAVAAAFAAGGRCHRSNCCNSRREEEEMDGEFEEEEEEKEKRKMDLFVMSMLAIVH